MLLSSHYYCIWILWEVSVVYQTLSKIVVKITAVFLELMEVENESVNSFETKGKTGAVSIGTITLKENDTKRWVFEMTGIKKEHILLFKCIKNYVLLHFLEEWHLYNMCSVTHFHTLHRKSHCYYKSNNSG